MKVRDTPHRNVQAGCARSSLGSLADGHSRSRGIKTEAFIFFGAKGAPSGLASSTGLSRDGVPSSALVHCSRQRRFDNSPPADLEPRGSRLQFRQQAAQHIEDHEDFAAP
jgi:hypothetical protein